MARGGYPRPDRIRKVIDDTMQSGSEATELAQTEQLNLQDTSLKNQQEVVLSALREGARTTIELRHNFGVMHPAARVQELREMGYRIDVVRVACATPDGARHKAVARYVLAPCDDLCGMIYG